MFSFISGGYLQESISNTYFWGYLFFIFIIDRYKYDYEKMLINVLLALALFILFLVGADFWGLIDVNTHYIPSYLHSAGEAMIGRVDWYPLKYIIFLKASPLLVFALFYYLEKKKYMFTVLIFIALVFSGTRANLIFPSLFIVVYLWITNEKLTKIMIVIASIGLSPLLLSGIKILNKAKETSEVIKYGHYISIIHELKDPINFLFGMGYGTIFYTSGLSDYSANTELSYLDFFRKSGFFNFVLLIFFIVRPIGLLYKSRKTAPLCAYLSYLLIAGTNPLLVSSTSMIGYVYIYSFFLKINGGDESV
ncbi:hypothetical protein [Cloacibacillus evryensis]|uniref:Uncharacterized protein n=1 Tax=Cloacibacillus evryensis TaxID=508460 RepID=A0AAW5K2K1_9BACT|nr:hypothetical protein [Cloacibacillus evryensis]MCQ4814662.1 hypothetical protein [Cloacibacillus evryensis]